MIIEEIRLPNLVWRPARRARIWLAQVKPHVPPGRFPLLPERKPGVPTGFELLQALCRHEAEHFGPPGDAPALILLPEFALRPEEVEPARELIRAARANTLFVVGIGQMSEAEVRRLEPRSSLWADESEGRFANCAVVGVGGSPDLYLQPKILPSRWERDYHWPGSAVRYFIGDFVQFIVVVCSELLGRPEDQTTIAEIVGELRRKGHALNLVIWIQHSPDPRSAEFNQSLNQLTYHRPTVLVVSSGSSGGRRLRNFGVSGAIVPNACLPRSFRDLDRRFHYVEPIAVGLPMSRIVLLRYDADVYRVETVLADVLTPDSGAARGELFHQAQPYVLDDSHLAPSDDNIHLVDISQKARDKAVVELAAPAAHVDSLQTALVGLGTDGFLGWLDVTVVPRPSAGDVPHAAGQQHSGGDTQCRCWEHRICIDNVADVDSCATPLSEVLAAAAIIAAQSVPIVPFHDRDRRTNFRLQLAGQEHALGIVYPFDFNADAARRAICGANETLVNSAYVVLGPGEGHHRRSVGSIDAARVDPVGAVDAGRSRGSVLNAVFERDFWEAAEAGTIANTLLEQLFVGQTR